MDTYLDSLIDRLTQLLFGSIIDYIVWSMVVLR